MTREQKLSLILGFALVLVVGVLVSDHLSGARKSKLNPADPGTLIATQDPPAIESEPKLILVDADGQSIPSPSSTLALGSPTTLVPQNEPTVSGTAVAHNPPSAIEDLRARLNGTWKDLRSGEGVAAAQPAGATISLIDPPTTDTAPRGQPEAAPTSITTADPIPTRQESTPEFRLYTVKDGDTMWSIATRLLGDGSRHKELADYNKGRLTAGGGLRVGASLRIPTSLMADTKLAERSTEPPATPKPADTKSTKAVPAPTKRQTPPTVLTGADTSKRNEPTKPTGTKLTPEKGKAIASSKPGTYTVQPGDTLGKIAAKTLGSSRRAEELAEANASVLDDEDTLTVGQKLKIPAR